MISRLSAKLRETAGQSVVEIAFVVPLVVLLVLGIFDFSRAILTNNIIINMSREGANLASRTQRTPQYIMNSLAVTSPSLAMGTNAMMYLAEVKVEGGAVKLNNGQFKITPWKENAQSDLNSQIDVNSVAQLAQGAKTQGDNIYVFEVVYRYDFLFGNFLSMLPANKILRSITIF